MYKIVVETMQAKMQQSEAGEEEDNEALQEHLDEIMILADDIDPKKWN